MANVRISNLPSVSAAALVDTDIVPVVAGIAGGVGVTSNITISQLRLKLGTQAPGDGRTVTSAAVFLANNAVINVKDFGAVGDGAIDDTTAVQNAINATPANGSNTVFFPSGTYKINQITLRARLELAGAGQGRTIIQTSATTGAGGILYANSGAAGTFLDYIYIHDITLDGRVATKGWSQFEHLMSLNGVRHVLIDRVTFLGMRGDGLYLGSGIIGGDERHNFDVTLRDCLFDGDVEDQRNGLSVIDCDKLLVDSCTFQNIGNATLGRSVGAIDFEPNNSFSTYNDITIRNCKFKNLDTANVAGITFFTAQQTGINIVNWNVIENSFENCYFGINASGLAQASNGFVDGLTIRANKFLNSTSFDLQLSALKNIRIIDNKFIVSPSGNASYRGSISLGEKSGASVANHAYDVQILNNVFKGLRPQFAAIWVLAVRGLLIESNDFDNISGSCIQFSSAATAGTRRYLDRIILQKNHVHNLDKITLGAPTTTRFINADAGINAGNDNCWINWTNIERDNLIEHGIPRIVGGVNTIFAEETRAAAPATGSWIKASKTIRTTPAAGAFADSCSVAGTIGVLAGATGDVVNGSATLLNVADPNDSLRVGQSILVGADAVVKQIIGYEGTTITLSAATTAATANGVALAWNNVATFVTI